MSQFTDHDDYEQSLADHAALIERDGYDEWAYDHAALLESVNGTEPDEGWSPEQLAADEARANHQRPYNPGGTP